MWDVGRGEGGKEGGRDADRQTRTSRVHDVAHMHAPASHAPTRWLSLDLWLVFGVLGFLLNFVPTVGTVVAVALPMPVVLLDASFSGLDAALALVLPLTAHIVAGNVLEPMLFGHSLNLSPVVVLLSLLAWGALWGVIGMVLAVPM